MDYNIQKKLHDILEKLQSKVNQGEYNPAQKKEAVNIITKIRNEYQFEIDEYFNKRNSIDNRFFNNEQLITDQSFMIEYVSTKKDVSDLGQTLLYLHKSIIIDGNVRWEAQFLKLVDLYFLRENDNLSKSEFLTSLIRWRFRHDDHNSKFNLELNHIIREKAFYEYIKEQILKNPEIFSEMLEYDTVSDFDLVRKFNELLDVQNSFLLDLIVSKYDVLKHVPEKFKEHFLINLFAINEHINARQYLHPTYKTNLAFCSLFE